MHHEMSNPEKANFFSLSPDEIDLRLGEWGCERYRGRQIREWIYHKLSADPARFPISQKACEKRLLRGSISGSGR